MSHDSGLTAAESEAVQRHLAGDQSPETLAAVEAAMARIIDENADRWMQEYRERQVRLVFRDCPGCGHAIGCLLQDDGTVREPTGCDDHT